MNKYLIVWWKMAGVSIQSALTHRWGASLFVAGKLIRFGLFIIFLQVLHQRVNQLASYSLAQMMVFFLVFNLVDLFGQIFFRGIYWFRNKVVSGEFDFHLVKPMNALFQALTAQTDILDVPLLVIVIAVLVTQPINLNVAGWLSLGAVLVSSLAIVTAIHIGVAALGVLTTEVDHTIMIYRDVSQMARFPVDIYTDWIRTVLTFVIPVAVAFTWPAKALMGLVSWQAVLGSVGAAGVSLVASLKLWNYALKHYASASS